MIRKAIATLQAQSIDIAGAVLNNINVMRDDYYYYYQSYYSDYYQRDDDDAEADLI
jgi:Mrp family chromosome partitioning ATPase